MRHAANKLATSAFILSVLTLGCAHTPPKEKPVVPVSMPAPVTLELKSVPGRVERTEIRSASASRSYENTQLLREHFEELDFTVETSLQSTDEKRGLITQQVMTIKKEGEGDLNALAFPELNQKIMMTLDRQGRVFHVAGYSPKTIFYVPSVSLPEKPVEVGDTWPLAAEWMSQDNGIPLKLDLVTILKRFVKCGSQTCAELELSGSVQLAVESKRGLDFKSELRGLMYFGTQTGSVVWSQVHNSEMLVAEQEKVQIESCIQARVVEPADERQDFASAFPCTASELKPQP